MKNRVVITGLGVVSPIGVGLKEFKNSLIKGESGIKFNEELKTLKFGCQVSGIPKLNEESKKEFIRTYRLNKLKGNSILFGCMSGLEAWKDAGLEIISKRNGTPDWDTGCIFGSGIGSIEAIDYTIKNVDLLKTNRLGGRMAQQIMLSGISAYLGGIIGLGNQVTTNSSACSTGTENIIMGFNAIRQGLAKRFLVGSTESNSPYIWAPFDSMTALTRDFNYNPEKASCPMSKFSSGFVPASGSGSLVIEDLDSALKRGAKIYAEILGGNINSGGQREGASMTLGNVNSVIKCIEDAIKKSNILESQIDLISGHLTSTIGDVNEIKAWVKSLNRKGTDFPYINSLKSMTGHCISASGSIEAVALALQISDNFIHPTLNTKELHPEISSLIASSKIPKQTLQNVKLNIAIKVSLGFGDVNSCLILKKWSNSY